MFNRKNLLKNSGQLLITFGTLGSPTCGFHLLLFSAGTPSAFIPALFSIYSFPRVHFPLSYLRFSPSRLFRRYASRFHTCGFHCLAFSAGTLPAFIPALFTVSAFPQVRFPLPYLRFSPFRLFRRHIIRNIASVTRSDTLSRYIDSSMTKCRGKSPHRRDL